MAYVCMSVCIYACMYVCIRVYGHINKYTDIYIYIYLYLYLYTDVHVYANANELHSDATLSMFRMLPQSLSASPAPLFLSFRFLMS